MKDMLDIMKDMKIYNENNHNKTDNIYHFSNGSEIHFFSVDDEQKIRGRKHTLLFLNEANELTFEIFNQLVMRCSGAVFIDYNPSDSEHWIYDMLSDTSKKSVLIKSTYKDNTFLKQDQIDYIEGLINADEQLYRVYCLGERPISNTRIYTHFKRYIDAPAYVSDISFGLDIGFNHPTALVKVQFVGEKLFIKELIYESSLTTDDLISKMNTLIPDCERGKTIYVDSARPDVIESLKRSGFKAVGATKNVTDGITYIKSKQVFISDCSVNLWREVKLYSWQSKGNTILDEPIKLNDDGMDAVRYSVYSHRKKGSGLFDYDFKFI